ncbi:MAG: hypothetical protein DWQ18_01695 [Crenarchaeota archaeon]|nr:MAG: hypothetical protein DWQ17_06835 [Thermoproteota archaeon]RDJ33669.1 MAG: hypothetical protein DWQ18_01695 [Thermoproteota archaeon]RDJ37247.1 MAG: hypothetical protein DWQ19_01905 [Thermoproteota archaeon]RDJ39201.1 MAG: hypothetical protein DWQ13_02795 [Thermoproteota archaeon]
MEYLTKYPKTVSFLDGIKESIQVDKEGVEQLHIVVKKSFNDLMKIFTAEGFTKVKFEHKQPSQIGNGLNLKLKKPWEMHVRFVELKKGLIAIHAEVEVSRDYLQHLFSQRTPVIYEVEEMLKRHNVDYKIWNARIRKYVSTVFENYKVKLATPSIPVFAWKPMLFMIGTVGIFYLWKYLNTI